MIPAPQHFPDIALTVLAHCHRTSRGIGLELTKQLLQSPSNLVLASCRNPAKADALQALTASSAGRLHVLPLNVNDANSIESAAQAAEKIVGDKGIDYLINNAGAVSPYSPLLSFCCTLTMD